MTKLEQQKKTKEEIKKLENKGLLSVKDRQKLLVLQDRCEMSETRQEKYEEIRKLIVQTVGKLNKELILKNKGSLAIDLKNKNTFLYSDLQSMRYFFNEFVKQNENINIYKTEFYKICEGFLKKLLAIFHKYNDSKMVDNIAMMLDFDINRGIGKKEKETFFVSCYFLLTCLNSEFSKFFISSFISREQKFDCCYKLFSGFETKKYNMIDFYLI